MFYSQCLLSKKGPLGTVWFAAHCHKRLKKDQVKHTDISSSVDKILLDEFPAVTYRILAFLLLGVVRIYSKKVQYLFRDCCDAVTRIGEFVVSKKPNRHIESICAPRSSISVPERLELDAFNLEDLEFSCGRNVKLNEDITLEDVCEKKGIGLDSLDKLHFEDDDAQFENCSTSHDPFKDVHLPNLVDTWRVEMQLSNSCNWEASMEKLRGSRFSLEECMDPMMLGEDEEEPKHASSFGEEIQVDEEQMEQMESRMDLAEEYQTSTIVRSFGNDQHMDAEQTHFPETETSGNEKLNIGEDRPLSISVDVTPGPKSHDGQGTTTPKSISVRTPAARERSKISKKRKCLYDDSIVVPNKVYKQWIDDPSGLVCRRKKVPHTALHVWTSYQIFSLPQSLMEPLIPYNSLDPRSSIIIKETLKTAEAVESEASKTLEVIEMAKISPSAHNVTATPPIIHVSPEETPIAPSTPVTQATSLRLHEVYGIGRSDRVEASISIQSLEEYDLSSSKVKGIDVNLTDEEINSNEGESLDERKWSTRTRSVARYLYRNFLVQKKEQKHGVLNLSQVLEGKTRKESARLFYEILVLKSGGFMEVMQDNPYEDIFVLETDSMI